jgi:hypothetical protein
VAVALLAGRVACRLPHMNESDNWFLWHYGRSHLEPLEPNAMLVSPPTLPNILQNLI